MSLKNEIENNTIVNRNIFLELDVDEFKKLRNELNNEIIIIKFGATWCGPCKNIKSRCEEWFSKLPSNSIIFDIDIDESLDLYMALKKYKMVNGIPSILVYYTKPKESDKWYIPDDSVSGGNINGIDHLFMRINKIVF